MTDFERDTERRITSLESNVNNFIKELRDFKTELRDRDNQRAAEIIELRQKHDADMKEIRSSINGMNKHVRNISVAAMAGVGTSVIAVVVLVGTVVYSVLSR